MHKTVLGKFQRVYTENCAFEKNELRKMKDQYISKLIGINHTKIIYTYIYILKAQEIPKCIA
jgi:hypothetical protein